jgi:hypothetical protein
VYNTDWYETWGGIDTLHVPWEGLTGRLTARYLDTELPRRQPRDPSDPLFLADVVGDGEPQFLGFEVLLEQDIAGRVAVGGTLNWRIYTYDSRFARLEELDAVALGAYLRYRPNSLLTFYFDYTYEDDYRYIQNDFRDVQAIRASLLLSW